MQVNFVMDEQTIGKNKKHLNPELVEVELTTIKGYKGFDFFIFKHKEYKKWFICEYSTGQIVGWDKNKGSVKKHAKSMLDEKTDKDKDKLKEFINNKTILNTNL